MDQYKKLKESLNRVPGLRQPEQNPVPQQPQIPTVVPQSHVHEAQHVQQPSSTILPHKEEPAHDGHQDTDSRVTRMFPFCTCIMCKLICVFPLDKIVASFQVDHQVDEVHPTVPHNTLSEKEEDQEGEAERRRELAEEEMAQAGQPQKLEEDPDQPQDEQQEEEEEGPEQEQPDGNALDRQRRHPQLVRTGSNNFLLSKQGLNRI